MQHLSLNIAFWFVRSFVPRSNLSCEPCGLVSHDVCEKFGLGTQSQVLFDFGMHFVYNTWSTEVIMVMWRLVYKTHWAGGRLSGEDLRQSTWSRSDIRVEDRSIIDESMVDNPSRCSWHAQVNLWKQVATYWTWYRPCVSLVFVTSVSHTARCYISGHGFNCLSVPLPTQSAMKKIRSWYWDHT